ncbi:uncharacterized protein N7483_005571 [Penicillium malachiteum]|uniref:uncharacterized protein n=1 Tax=Penicillium malachiteum TaxID=1324776 RepID=UPI002547A422|nr:uncharacterized protein N7483_005571 [Penicillium malachiteum]KAJ5731063.1 hypothetical protein N7483_005571 [Penicillium malachiteum]
MDHLQPFTFSGARPSHSEPTSKAAPLDRPSFTFIDHDDDLTSKRIKDVNARKAIRSHVMRDVRRRERLAGTKRTSKREGRGQPTTTKSQCNTVEDSEERRLVLRNPSQSLTTTTIEASIVGTCFSPRSRLGRDRPPRWTAAPVQCHFNPNPRSLPTAWFFDPFCSLPGADELPSRVAHLIYYWKTVFVPMTFPSGLVGSEIPELDLMVRSSFSDPGSFFGLMSMCAAHRAALGVNHLDALEATGDRNRVGNDTDYCIMKAKSMREMTVKCHSLELSTTNEAFDTIVNLLTGALIAGLFDEARIHLTGLKRMVELRGGLMHQSISSSSILSAIITGFDPPESSPIRRLGSGFWANTLLSPALLRILNVARDIIFYSISVHLAPHAILQSDHDFFRVLNCETEHQLLSYVYDNGADNNQKEPEIYPIEAVTRVASICFLNYFLIVSPPSSGLGRALTRHLMKAVNNCKLTLLMELPKENFGLYAWALFIGAQGSLGQNERPWFVERLARVAILCEWQSWEQVSRLLTDYFYIAVAQGPGWQAVWDEAMAGFVIADEA